MKTLISFLLVLVCTFLVQAQEKPDNKKPIPFEKKHPGLKDNPFGSSPQFELPVPEAPSLTDSLVKKPKYRFGADGSVKDTSGYFNMPVMRPGAAFSSNMPIMVPDSTVHYFILNKKIEMNNLKPEANK